MMMTDAGPVPVPVMRALSLPLQCGRFHCHLARQHQQPWVAFFEVAFRSACKQNKCAILRCKGEGLHLNMICFCAAISMCDKGKQRQQTF
eukprot:4479357-Karenia_brevis.AAC.1